VLGLTSQWTQSIDRRHFWTTWDHSLRYLYWFLATVLSGDYVKPTYTIYYLTASFLAVYSLLTRYQLRSPLGELLSRTHTHRRIDRSHADAVCYDEARTRQLLWRVLWFTGLATVVRRSVDDRPSPCPKHVQLASPSATFGKVGVAAWHKPITDVWSVFGNLLFTTDSGAESYDNSSISADSKTQKRPSLARSSAMS